MKRVLILTAFIVGCGGSESINFAKADLEDVFKPYAIEKGYIVYKYSGVEEGKEILIFDKWGHLQKRNKETQSQGVPLKNFQLQSPDEIYSYSWVCECLEYKIKKEPGVYYYDKEKGEYVEGNPYCIKKNKVVKVVNGVRQLTCDSYAWEGSRRPNALYYVLRSIWDTASAKTRQTLGPIFRDLAREMNLGFIYSSALEKLPVKRKIAGKDTEVFKVYGKDIRLFVWKNIILGSEVLTPGKKLIVEAIEVNEKPKIDENTFKLPEDFPPPVIYDTLSQIFKNEKYVAEQVVNMYLQEKLSKK